MVGKRPSTFGCGAQADTDTRLAGLIKRLFAQGDKAKAREHFGEIVERHQRRASRVAYHYLRDAAEVDDAVQDAFVKAFVHLPSFREELPFEVWFTRIVINGCLDRLKARARRGRWMVGAGALELELDEHYARPEPSPEDRLLTRERRARLVAAVERVSGEDVGIGQVLSLRCLRQYSRQGYAARHSIKCALDKTARVESKGIDATDDRV